MSRLYVFPLVCAYLSRDLGLPRGRRRIRESWNLLLLLCFIRRMLEYIYGKKIQCFRDKLNASKRVEAMEISLTGPLANFVLSWCKVKEDLVSRSQLTGIPDHGISTVVYDKSSKASGASRPAGQAAMIIFNVRHGC